MCPGTLDRVRAQERELLARPELVPQLLETDRGVAVPLAHSRATISPNAWTAGARSRVFAISVADRCRRTAPGPATVDHEPVERVARVERHVTGPALRPHDVEPGGEALLTPVSV
jgi:hypothetical protein